MHDDVNDLTVVVTDCCFDRCCSRVRLRERLATVERDCDERDDPARLAVDAQIKRLSAGQFDDDARERSVQLGRLLAGGDRRLQRRL